MLRVAFTNRRGLDRGNASPETISADFARFDLDVWAAAQAASSLTSTRRARLEQLTTWRNAIAHQDFVFSQQQQASLSGTSLSLAWPAAGAAPATASPKPSTGLSPPICKRSRDSVPGEVSETLHGWIARGLTPVPMRSAASRRELAVGVDGRVREGERGDRTVRVRVPGLAAPVAAASAATQWRRWPPTEVKSPLA